MLEVKHSCILWLVLHMVQIFELLIVLPNREAALFAKRFRDAVADNRQNYGRDLAFRNDRKPLGADCTHQPAENHVNGGGEEYGSNHQDQERLHDVGRSWGRVRVAEDAPDVADSLDCGGLQVSLGIR